jgi:hypothetical protein
MVDKMDGLAPFSAARSCRDINMEHPNTADGTYKLKTRTYDCYWNVQTSIMSASNI